MFHELETDIQNRFLLERELKTGERGAVALLRERTGGRRVVYRRFLGNGDVYEVLKNVDCPYLPKVEQVARQDGQVLVLEEYIPGDTLAFLLKERPLSEEQAREILIQVCRGLKVLHSFGVVHRDVKPENIILRGDEAVLIDFDVSRVCKEKQTSDTQVMGTTGYAAPEQFGFSQTDARADIFALGVMLNEMLIRRHPSRELAIGKMRPIIEKCIEVNVDKRYSSVDELLSALNAAAPRKKKPKKWWMLLAVAILAVAVWALSGDVKQPEEKPQTDLSVQTDLLPQSEPLQQEKVLWHGDTEVYGTRFWYDLDEDGEREEYVFAAMFDFVGEPRLLQHSGSAINEKPEVMEVVPAVWVQTGENSYEPVEEFAPLLTDAAVNLRQIEGEYEGLTEDIGALYGIWSGAIRATFKHVGLWYYECSASLAGETLTAVGRTMTDLQEEEPPSAQPYMTAFQYDMDGDGAEETYWFGVISSIENGKHPMKRDQTEFFVGSGSDRCVAPAVWRETAEGEYEDVPQFAPLLENVRVNLRCVEGEVQPKVTAMGDLFEMWSGGVSVTFTHEGVWVYECSAVLDGMELTAAAVTYCKVRLPET